MSICWKCNAEIASGNECEPFCSAGHEEELEADELPNKNFCEVDWEKVTNFEQLKLVLSVAMHDWIYKGHPDFEKIKPFTKEIPIDEEE